MAENGFVPMTFTGNDVTIEAKRSAVSGATSGTTIQDITVAAIIPLYNGAPFIREALESVLTQTEPADEIIVVDDGSTDDGAGVAIVKEMAKDHSIRLLTKKNGGQGSARNTGIAACSCSHIALLDQDDIWYDDHVAILKRPFLKGHRYRNLGLVYGNMDRIDKLGRMVSRNLLDDMPSPHPKTSLAQCLRRDMYILPGASLFTKAAWEQVGGFDERLSGYEDDDLFIRMFSAQFESIFLKKAVFKWRIYSDSTSYSPRMARSRMIYFHKLIASYPDEPRLNLYWGRDEIGPRFFQILYGEFIDGSRLRDLPRMTQAWSDIKEVLPVMPRRLRRRMVIAAPLINLFCRGSLTSLARSIFRLAARRKR
jgi:glycosyltransferase involved in cell wall biosynthesis